MADSFTVSITLSGNDQFSGTANKANQSLQQLNRTAEGTAEASKNSALSMSDLNSVLGQVGVTLSIGAFVQGAIELEQLGQEANRAEATFTQLAGGEEAAATMLNMLRESTRGVVDDMALMNASNKFMMMGLAETTEQAAQLSEMAVTLGAAVGNDATTSMGDFAAMLANQSIPRLDNFGISSSRVRERIEELKAAGMGMQEAFTQAVLEIGADSMERLGDAAAASANNVQVLATRFTNAAQDIGQGIADIANAAAGTVITIADGVTTITTHYQEVEEAARSAAEGMTEAFLSTVDDPAIEQLMRNNEDLEGFYVRLFDLMRQFPEATAEQLASALNVTGTDELNVAYQEAIDLALERRQAELAMNDVLQRQQEIVQDITAAATEQATTISFQQQEQAYIRQQQLEDEHAQILRNSDTRLAAFQGMSDAYAGMSDGIELFTPEQAAYARALADEAQRVVDSIPQLEAQGQIFSEEEVDALSTAADDAERMATAAERGAEAFQNMSLSDVFGQTEGGMAGEISDDLLAFAEESGMSEEDLAALQTTLDEASGRINEASQGYQEDVIPMLDDIRTTLGDEAMLEAIQNLREFYAQAALLGLTPEQIAAGQEDATGFREGEDGQMVAIQNFDPTEYANSLAEADTSLTNMSASSQELRDALILAEPSMSNLALSADTFNTKMVEATSALTRLSTSVNTVRLNIVATGDTWVAGLTGGTGTNTQDNGGMPTGIVNGGQ